MAENIEHIRHSLAHLLASAVTELYPYAQPTIGPATVTGFYYDFDFSAGDKLTEADLEKIETKMRELLPSWTTFERKEVSEDEAREYFKDNPYKLELIDDIIEAGEPITFYTSGTFTDLCRGGHVKNMQNVAPDSFKLDKIAGAYWRGDETKQMLTRIYGIAFESQDALEAYEKQMEEAKERDHRKIGKEMNLFTFSDLVGSGLPMWTPKGTALRRALQDKLESISKKYGAESVTIPHLAKQALYETSGHATKFADELLKVISKYDEFVLKPVNCPHHTQIYASVPRSYRDLPLRFIESTMQYRDEKPGEIGGLTRVRAISVDDGHTFCTPDQIEEEAKNIAHIIEEFYTSLGLYGNHWVSLSVRDPQNLDAYIGDDEGWEKAESMLQKVSDDLNLEAQRVEGEAAIYGPKLDFMFKDSLGREWQLATIQIDFAMPSRFKLQYTASDGSKQTPVMIHRAILGSYERFLAILMEHFAGAFPYWLAPVQITVLPVKDVHHEYAENIASQLREQDIRVELNAGKDSLGKRLHATQKMRVPYTIIIGDNEVANNTVTVESRDDGKWGEMSVEELYSKL